MQKLSLQTPDITSENIEKIQALFPEVITEREDENGNLVKGIDFELLQQKLARDIVEGSDERYRLDWPGKKRSILKANTPINKTLSPDYASSVDFENTENIYIEGDNFEVLKILQESYLGKIKMIYIDPPYNTGKDFVYRDNFKVSKEDYEEELGVEDEEGGRLFKNTDTNGRFHSDWLSMMYERLVIARDLLIDDGVIFMSIDDNEVHNLRKIADEIFGENNFIEIFNWVKTETPANLSKKSKKVIEYILCYQKNNNEIKFKGVKKDSISSNGLLNQTNSISILRFPKNIVRTSIENGTIKAGQYGTDAYDIDLLEDTEVKDNIFIKDVVLKAKFKWSQDYLDNEIKSGTLIRIPTLKFSPSYEKEEYDEEVPPNLINSKVGVGTNENAGTQLQELFDNKKVFDYPKPVSLIKYLMNFNLKDEDIILDFFSGSGTTAEAVMEVSLITKCKYICVQLPEKLDINNGKTEAEKLVIENAINLLNSIKKPLNISELAMERIRRAGKKIVGENAEKLAEREKPLDIGFRAYKVADTIYNDVFVHPENLKQEALLGLADNIKSDKTPEDILTAVMLSLGLTLDLPIKSEKVGVYTVFTVADGALVVCFDMDIDMNLVETIAKQKPLRAVFRDASFRDDQDRINTEITFKQLSPETRVNVI
jgi:adenine-specific DNA-methyltransferase